MILTAIITVIGAYFLGSVNFAVLFTKHFTQKDVRNFGSGNAGSTNAMRIGGTKSGILTFVCDCIKGALAALLGYFMFRYIGENNPAVWANAVYGEYICGVTCLLGHIFPLFFGFKGGKGVATGLGIFFVICPIAAGIGLLAFIVTFLITRMVSLGSIVGTFVTVITALIVYNKGAALFPQIIMVLACLIMILVKHKDNIKRIIEGNEDKFSK